MDAALSASDETVSLLLSLGANPDKSDDNGYTALMFAIESKCIATINLLAPVTKVNLGEALGTIARNKADMKKEELRQLVERAAQDEGAAIKGLTSAATFGSSEIMKMFAENMSDHSIFEAGRERLWKQKQSSPTGKKQSPPSLTSCMNQHLRQFS